MFIDLKDTYLFKEGRQEGRQEGVEATLEVIKELKSAHSSLLEQIAKKYNISVDEVISIAQLVK